MSILTPRINKIETKKYARATIDITNATGSIVASGSGVVDFSNVFDDPNGLITPGASWSLAVDEDGIYELDCFFGISHNFDAATEEVLIRVDTSDLSDEPFAFKQIAELQAQANTGTEAATIRGRILLKMRAGESLDVFLVNNTANSISLVTSPELSQLSIMKISEIDE